VKNADGVVVTPFVETVDVPTKLSLGCPGARRGQE